MIQRIWFALAAMMLTVACAPSDLVSYKNFTQSQSVSEIPNNEVPINGPLTEADLSQVTYRWDKVSAGSDWTMMTSQAIDEFGVLSIPTPSDITSFCPRYPELNSLERRMFWIYLLSAMVERESSFRPETTYQENFKDNSGQFIISRGLLQLSIESSLGYDCPLENAEQLHDPQTNLSCGMRILSHFLRRDGVITGKVNNQWRGGARYWAVLRNDVATLIKSWTNSIDLCK